MQFNINKCVGQVIFIVEGARFEFNFLLKIFVKLLKYSQVQIRNYSNNKKYEKYIDLTNPNNIIYVINLPNSNIKFINDEIYLDTVFKYLIDNYDLDIDNAKKYFIFDRDPLSNININIFKKLISQLYDPYDNVNNLGGKLIISYPSIESYIISCSIADTYKKVLKLGKEAKDFINKNKLSINDFTSNEIINAALEFYKYLKHNKLKYDMQNYLELNKCIFDIEEAVLLKEGGFNLFSQFSIILIDLGIIE